jgi:hypothetical protein
VGVGPVILFCCCWLVMGSVIVLWLVLLPLFFVLLSSFVLQVVLVCNGSFCFVAPLLILSIGVLYNILFAASKKKKIEGTNLT